MLTKEEILKFINTYTIPNSYSDRPDDQAYSDGVREVLLDLNNNISINKDLNSLDLFIFNFVKEYKKFYSVDNIKYRQEFIYEQLYTEEVNDTLNEITRTFLKNFTPPNFFYPYIYNFQFKKN